MRNPKQNLARRGVLAGAGTAGALATAAALLPKTAQPEAESTPATSPASDTAAGYRLTEHVKQYYRTAKI
jgi:hypothetical protein